jgi:hypothetical protein
MITFKQFINEIKVPKTTKTWGVPRSIMPQVRAKHINKFIDHLKKNDIEVKKVVVDPKKLKAIQGEFDKEKIKINMEKLKNEPLKPIIISDDNYVIDGNHRWVASMNAGIPITAYKANKSGQKLLAITNRFKKVKYNVIGEEAILYEAFEFISEDDEVCDIISPRHMKEFEKFVDRMFEKFNIDFDFTKHFRERMGDDRNKPCISMKELAGVIKKIYQKQGKSIKDVAGAEAVIKDLQSDLNIPVAVEYNPREDEFRVAMKTIMRKKNFATPNKVIKV